MSRNTIVLLIYHCHKLLNLIAENVMNKNNGGWYWSHSVMDSCECVMNKEYDIVTCRHDYRRGFGSVSRFIGHAPG
jgi:hypothetical protein